MSEEKTIFRGSPSLLTRFGGLFLCFVIIAGCVTGAVLMKDQLAARWVFAGLASVTLFYALAVIVVVKATEYEVTSHRIRIRRGILTKRLDELELYRANDTSLIEPLSLRMFGLGTIEVRTVDSSTPTVYLEAIHRARDVREQLRMAIEECRDRKGVRLTEFENPGPDT